MLALALRQAWRKGGKVAVLDPRPVFLPFDFEHLPLGPGNLNAALGMMVAGALADRDLAALDAGAQQFFGALPREDGGLNPIQDRLATIGKRLARPAGRSSSAALTWSGSPPRPWPPTWPGCCGRPAWPPASFTCCPAPTPSAPPCCRAPVKNRRRGLKTWSRAPLRPW